MDKVELTCIGCSKGCAITVSLKDGKIEKIKGNSCKTGEKYAIKEIKAPTRIVTSTVKVRKGKHKVVSVKTQSDIPKESIFSVMEVIKNVKVEAPVYIGDIIVKNVCNTGVDIVATKNAKVKKKNS